MENCQQGGSGDRKNMDSVSGWGKAGKGDSSRLRHRRNSGRFDGEGPGVGAKPKRKKTKTLRHLYMKYLYEIKQHIEHCESDRKYEKWIIGKWGSVEAYRKKGYWHRRWRWSQESIKKTWKKIKAAGGETNYRRILDAQ